MRIKLSKFITIFVLTGWFALQAVVVSHEYSADHLDSTSEHICLANIAQFDDYLIGDNAGILIPVDSLFIPLESNAAIAFLPSVYSSHSPRAPPVGVQTI